MARKKSVTEFCDSIEPLRLEICNLQAQLQEKIAEYRKLQEDYWNNKEEA